MIALVAKRLLTSAIALAIALLCCYAMTRLLPGDPFLDDPPPPKEMYELLRRQWGLDDPWYEQFRRWSAALLKGDLGYSMAYPDRKVTDIIVQGIGPTAMLAALALSIAMTLSLAVSFIVSVSAAPVLRRVSAYGSMLCFSTPTFLLAIMLQYFFTGNGMMPVARYQGWTSLVLPSVALALGPAAYMSRLLIEQIEAIENTPYWRLAQAKGLTRARLYWRHAFPNAIIPLLGYLGALAASVFMGSFVVEKVFAIPGIGQWLVKSIASRDYTLIVALTGMYCILIIVCVLITDLLTLWADPRQRTAK